MSTDPFAALAALRDSLPEGSDNPSAREAAPDERESSRKPVATMFFERKGRGGKEATVIEFSGMDLDQVARTGAELKRKLGTGGSSRGNEVLLQGDRRAQARDVLTAMGIRVKN